MAPPGHDAQMHTPGWACMRTPGLACTPWACMHTPGLACTPLGLHAHPWDCMHTPGLACTPLGLHAHPWACIRTPGRLRCCARLQVRGAPSPRTYTHSRAQHSTHTAQHTQHNMHTSTFMHVHTQRNPLDTTSVPRSVVCAFLVATHCLQATPWTPLQCLALLCVPSSLPRTACRHPPGRQCSCDAARAAARAADGRGGAPCLARARQGCRV